MLADVWESLLLSWVSGFFSRPFTWNELINGSSNELQMELRVHGGPALFFPSFRRTLSSEQFPGTANQLLLLGSIVLGSDLVLVCRDQMRECVGEVLGAPVRAPSPSCTGMSGWAPQNTYEGTVACEHQCGACRSWESTRGVSGSYTMLAPGKLMRLLEPHEQGRDVQWLLAGICRGDFSLWQGGVPVP